MKKLVLFAAIAVATVFASCGGNTETSTDAGALIDSTSAPIQEPVEATSTDSTAVETPAAETTATEPAATTTEAAK